MSFAHPEGKCAGTKQPVGIPDQYQLQSRLAISCNTEHTFVERQDLAAAAACAFWKDKQITTRRQMTANALQMLNHRGTIHFGRGRRNVSRLSQKPAENGHAEKSIFNNRCLSGEQGYQQDWVQIRNVIANNNGRPEAADLLIDFKGRAGRQKAQPGKKTFQMNMVHFL